MYSEPFRTHQAVATIVDNSRNTKAYFDLIGPLPYTSSCGFTYIFLLYDYNSKAILTKPLKSQSATEIKKCLDNFTY